jgi:hypothetical protein
MTIRIGSRMAVLAAAACVCIAAPAVAQDGRARAQVRAAAEAMGGEARLRALTALRIRGIGHRNMLEQSERPEGPWLVSYQQVDELRDHAAGRVAQHLESRDYNSADWSGYTRLLAGGAVAYARGGRMGPGPVADARELADRLALSPERVLLTALAAPDLASGRDTALQDGPQHVVRFTHRGAQVRLFLSIHSALPTAVETTVGRPQDGFFGVWGDVTRRTYLSMWSLEPGGLSYPHQWDVEWRGLPAESFTVLTLDLAPAVSDDSFAITPEARQAFARMAAAPPAVAAIGEVGSGRPRREPVEVAPGIIVLPGRWYATLVRQDDGIVVIEAPISSEYSAQVLAEAERRFPGVPVKAVISTSDAWPHIGGVREYVARGIPVYTLDLNCPILARLAAAPFALAPDALARSARRPQFRVISEKTVIGTGENRIELIPPRGEESERMMLAYLPGRRVLYASDLLQRMPDGSFFFPEYPYELAETVRREHLDVQTVSAMHMSPIPWPDVLAAVRQAIAPAAR